MFLGGSRAPVDKHDWEFSRGSFLAPSHKGARHGIEFSQVSEFTE